MAHTTTTNPTPHPSPQELAQAATWAREAVEETQAALQKATLDYETVRDRTDVSEETVRDIGDRYERAMIDWTDALETHRDLVAEAEGAEEDARYTYRAEQAAYEAARHGPFTREQVADQRRRVDLAYGKWMEEVHVLDCLGVEVDTSEPDGADA